MNAKETPISPTYYKILFAILLVLATGLAVWAGYNHLQVNAYRTALQNTYYRAADLAADNLSNLSSDLVKGMYAGTSPQLSMISSKMWKESAAAKSALSSLPISGSTLENTNRFLSQAGDYAMYLSRKTASGAELTDEERNQFASLREYADRLSEQMDAIACALQNGELTIEELMEEEFTSNPTTTDNSQSSGQTVSVSTQPQTDSPAEAPTSEEAETSHLQQIEDGFMGYPTLIYDGPFSDHILERTPLMTEGQPEVSAEQARITAANAAGKELSEMREEDSILPSYVFHDALSTSVAITKNGGYLCYLITEKPDNLTAKLSYEEAVNKAQQYLSAHGYDSMKDTYYETDNGVMTLNFAYYDSASQTICYTDLIKVEVSLQDGSILGLDARGYLVNHHDRTIAEPALTVEQAQESLSDALTVDSVRPALIPSSGQNEVATYEFLCSSATGDRILVYINSQTGAEEQLLILLQTPNGTLTK